MLPGVTITTAPTRIIIALVTSGLDLALALAPRLHSTTMLHAYSRITTHLITGSLRGANHPEITSVLPANVPCALHTMQPT